MSGILHPADGSFWAEEVFLINNATIALLLGVFVAAVLTRFLTMLLAPRLMSKIIHSEKVRSVAVRNSDKALGSAAGAGLALYLVNMMIDMMAVSYTHLTLPTKA